MRARQLAFALLALLALVGIATLWHQQQSNAVPNKSPTSSAQSKPAATSSSPPHTQLDPKSVSNESFLSRQPAATAARNYRRAGLAWVLRQLGASETLLDRLADGDLATVIEELRQQAARGDHSAVNILGWIWNRNCHWGRSEQQISGYLEYERAKARDLASADATWFGEVLQSDAASDRKFALACHLIDSDQLTSWVSNQAEGGDAASLWLRYRQTAGQPDFERLLKEAADAGFPEAQFELAFTILDRRDGAAGDIPPDVSVMNLLHEAADKVPRAEATLAVCEYFGCEGVAPDVSAAITHARDAAAQGVIDALLDIAPHLSTSQISPDEAAAWKLIQASLQQKGCGISSLSVDWMKSNSEALSTANTSPGALEVAAQIWQNQGPHMLAEIGCAS